MEMEYKVLLEKMVPAAAVVAVAVHKVVWSLVFGGIIMELELVVVVVVKGGKADLVHLVVQVAVLLLVYIPTTMVLLEN